MRTWIILFAILLTSLETARPADSPSGAGPQNPGARPEHAVALAFLAPCGSYLTFVAPLLKKHQFGATFFVDDSSTVPAGSSLSTSEWMNWPQISQLSGLGFEIGNATTNCRENIQYQSRAQFLQRLTALERRCSDVGIPKPVTFCYPDGWSSAPAIQMLADQGYTAALEYRTGLIYDPAQDHPLLLPAAWFYGRAEEREKFHQILENHPAGAIPVLLFDGIDSPRGGTHKDQFEEYLKFLADNHYTVLSVGDLGRMVNAAEALHAVRLWRKDGHDSLRMARQAAPPQAGSDASGPPTLLQRQLEALLLPKVGWQDAPLESVLKVLTTEVSTRSKGLIQPGLAPEPGLDLAAPVTLHLANIPVMEILRYLGDEVGVDFRVDQRAIVAKPKGSTSAQTTAKTPATAEQRTFFEALIIPDLDVDQVPLLTVVSLVRQKVSAVTRGRLDLNLLVAPGVDPTRPVSLHLANTPFAEILRYLGDLAEADVAVNRYAISFEARLDIQPRSPSIAAGNPAMSRALETLTLPNIEFKEASLGSVLEYLRRKAAIASGGRVRPSFVVYPEVDALAPVTLSMSNVPFAEALRYCGELSGTEYVFESYAIAVRRKVAPTKAAVPVPFALVK